jgi:hypothetical protein
MTNLVAELRKLHAEITASDGHECEMMALVRRAADTLEGASEPSPEALDAERYRWLRSHISRTIIQRFNSDERDWRPEKMDVLVDSRLHLNRPAEPV